MAQRYLNVSIHHEMSSKIILVLLELSGHSIQIGVLNGALSFPMHEAEELERLTKNVGINRTLQVGII